MLTTRRPFLKRSLWNLSWMAAVAWLGSLLLSALSATSHAQGFGIGALLNPEGSRLFPQSIVFPRHPGKPDPRWRSFDWRFTETSTPLETASFRLYFYDEEKWAAQYTLPRIQSQVDSLVKKFGGYRPSKKFSYLLFTSQREFQQANIFFVSEGVQGITSTQEATMAIPYWGHTKTFDHISKHEMTHQFQVQKMMDLSQKHGSTPMVLIPLWFIEGMAEHYSLGGVDRESRLYIRDLLVHPDPKQKHEVPEFFKDGIPSFLTVYKVGQAKIDFIEKQYGEGTAQRLLENGSKTLGIKFRSWPEFVLAELGQSKDQVEQAWKKYLETNYKAEADRHTQSLASWDWIREAGETLDLFEVSPNGRLIVVRQVDPLSGVVSLKMWDTDLPDRKTEVTHDQQADVMGLYFFQFPNLALSDRWVAYSVETASGPEIEAREIRHDLVTGKIRLGKSKRVKLHGKNNGLLQASSLAISQDDKRIAFVGLNASGKADVFTVDGLLDGENGPKVQRLTESHFHWRNLQWHSNGRIIGSSDRLNPQDYGIFELDPETKQISPLLVRKGDDLIGAESYEGGWAFQSWQSGSPQLHLWVPGKGETRLTDVKTGLLQAKFRKDRIYALGFMGGRYRLFRVRPDQWTRIPVEVAAGRSQASADPSANDTWAAELAQLPPQSIESYRPFRTSGTRIDQLGGFLSTGSLVGISASVSDLMRNYSVSGDFLLLGGLKNTNTSLFVSSQKGRTTWTTGGYYVLQPRLDSDFALSSGPASYIHREFGGLVALQYPLGPFTYIDAELRLGGVNRTDFDQVNGQLAAWNAVNPGLEFLAAPMLRFGYDRVLYEAYSGPLEGFGFLAESDTSLFPRRGAVIQRLRLDVAQYFQLFGPTVLALQGIAGGTWGGNFKGSFLLSSDDILRAYPFGDDRLFGDYLIATKAELRFPIGSFFGFPPLRGLAAFDIGSIFNDRGELGKFVTSSTTGGLSLNLPPISFNFMLSFPQRTAPGPRDSTVAHFTLRYLYL